MSRDSNRSDPSPIKALLGSAATRFGLDDALSTGELWTQWAEVVGADVAAHAQPTSLRGGVLRIRADSPVWAHEIGYLADEIKRKANAALGRAAVAEVRVWNAPGPSAVPASPGPAPGPAGAGPPGTEERRARSPEDDPLEALERARNAWRGRRRGGPR